MPYDRGKWASAFAPRRKGEKRYWLVKSEPDVFSFDHLLEAKGRTTAWDGVRNTGARNFLRDGMQKGDGVLFYRSNAVPSAVVGLCTVVRAGYPDATAFDEGSEYFDPESDRATPMWYAVDLRADAALKRPVTLAAIKGDPALSEMALLRVSRLSVIPVTPREWERICVMGG